MKLLTKEIVSAFKKQGDTSEMEMEEIKVIAKFFNPIGASTWYLYEFEEEEGIFWCFANLGDPTFAECGTVALKELEDLRLPMGLRIERDMHFPIGKHTLREIIDKVKSGGYI